MGHTQFHSADVYVGRIPEQPVSSLTRNQVLALIAVLAGVALLTAGALLRSLSASAGSGASMHETFAHAPAAPLPVEPPSRAPLPVSQFAPNPSALPRAETLPDELVVHVVGAVKRPGVFRLKPGARWEDALKAAGGPRADAAPDAVNLAAKLEDGRRIVIPTKSQAAHLPPTETFTPPSDAPKAPVSTPFAARSNKLTDPSQGRIDLNSATEEQLERVPGIGPSTAAGIIEYRQRSHGFKTVEDLMQVPGIGEKKFEKMHPFLNVH
jgi:competence protein ComEA